MNFLAPVADAPEGAILGIRPEHLRPEADGPIRGTITHVEHLGGDTNIVLDTRSGEKATIRMFGQHRARVGEKIAMGFNPSHGFLFDAEGQRLG